MLAYSARHEPSAADGSPLTVVRCIGGGGLSRETYGVRNLVFLDDALLADRRRIGGSLNSLMERQYRLTWKAASVSAWQLDDDCLN